MFQTLIGPPTPIPQTVKLSSEVTQRGPREGHEQECQGITLFKHQESALPASQHLSLLLGTLPTWQDCWLITYCA